MNSHQPVMPPVPPAVPFVNGRPGQNVPYNPQTYPPAPYPAQYPYPYHMQYQRPPPTWSPYPMHMPMGRGPPSYPPMNPYHHPQANMYNGARPVPQHNLSSTSLHSSQGMLSPGSSQPTPFSPPTAPRQIQSPQPTQVAQAPTPKPRSPSPIRTPFYPPLPWQSFEGTFAPRRTKKRRKPRELSKSVELPQRPEMKENTQVMASDINVQSQESTTGPTSSETPPTSDAPSEVMSTQPTTPTSSVPPQQTTPKASASIPVAIPSVSIRPAVPSIPLPSRPRKKVCASLASDNEKSVAPVGQEGQEAEQSTASQNDEVASNDAAVFQKPEQPAKVPPKSWADLLKSKASAQTAPSSNAANPNSASEPNGVISTRASSLADVLSSFNVKGNLDTKLAFIEPRGLVNSGNMCYMNSILQSLLFCVPFYAFLDRVGKQATHSFKSDTPMMDAMIMFMREFKVIDAAVSTDQLRMRLRDNELEQYGESFVPDFVYDVIRRLSRFSSMRRGHQQDAEEFLGFLLEELHDECSRTMKSANQFPADVSAASSGLASPESSKNGSQAGDEGWLEVGPKQKPSVTRSSGITSTESPINKIFGGKLRSELRVPGLKTSVTLEPYQPLQLDIGAPNVNNVVDALKNLTKSEILHGDFNSPRGPGATATKQVMIETLPEVLILHMKRFEYNNHGGTQKIWKKIGYPLDLEIPKEVFPQHKRGALMAHGGLPKYRLITVIYHHGKNAGVGHYTVDVRRQEGREWIRLDDTVIRRIRSEEVAAGGNEEDPKVLAAALEQHKKDDKAMQNGNVFQQFAADSDGEEAKSEQSWSKVAESSNGPAHARKKSTAVNGNLDSKASESGKATPTGRPTSIKDNKVAYILFYQKISA